MLNQNEFGNHNNRHQHYVFKLVFICVIFLIQCPELKTHKKQLPVVKHELTPVYNNYCHCSCYCNDCIGCDKL